MNKLRIAVLNQTAELPFAFWILWVSVLLDWTGKFVRIFLTLYLAEDLGLDVEIITLIITVNGIAALPAPMLGGILADKWGRRFTTVLGYFSTAIVLLLLSLAHTVSILLILAVCFGFVTSASKPALAALMADIVGPEKRAQAFSFNYWAINIGATIALPLAGWLATFDYTLLFIGDALTNIIAGLLILFLVKVPRHATRQEQQANQSRKKSSIWGALSDPLMFRIALLVFLFSTVYFQTQVALPLDMSSKGISEIEFGSLMAINSGLIVLLQLPLSKFLANYAPARVLALGGLFLGIGFGLTGFVTTPILLATTIAIWTLGEMIFFPNAMSLVADIAPPEKRAQYQGLFMTVWRPTSVLGVALGGILLDRWGSQVWWSICFVLGLMVFGGFMLLQQRLNPQMQPLMEPTT